MLNLPISLNKKLEDAKTILIVGAGGGSDVLAGLPLYYTFLKQGKKVHLANLTHTDFKIIHEHTEPIVLDQNLFGANATIKYPSTNYVEGYLSQYFKAALNKDNIVWMINKTNVKELKKVFEKLVDHLKIDAIVFVDGGVDSIMSGDEGKDNLTHKFIDTSLILATIQQIESLVDKTIFVSCNKKNHNRVLSNNISKLSLQGGFYGGLFLVNYMNSYKLMKSAYLYIKSNNNFIPEIEYLIKITDSDFDESEENVGPMQYLFINTEALIYNNKVLHKIIEANSYYDIVQSVAPFIKKSTNIA